MTVIAGIRTGLGAWIGGDSFTGSNGWPVVIMNKPKVAQNGKYLIGFSGIGRGEDLIHRFAPPPPPAKDLDRFIRVEFIDSLREHLRAGGILRKENDVETTEAGFAVLVATQGRLFIIHSDLQVLEPADGIAAVGSGAKPALGALHALSGQPSARIRRALEIAALVIESVRPPFTILKARP